MPIKNRAAYNRRYYRAKLAGISYKEFMALTPKQRADRVYYARNKFKIKLRQLGVPLPTSVVVRRVEPKITQRVPPAVLDHAAVVHVLTL